MGGEILLVNVSNMKVPEALKKYKVVSVIRAENAIKAREMAEACIYGGIKLIEVTFSFPNAEKVIADLVEKKECLIGAGTVLSLEMAEKAAQSGAKFIVSPHTDGGIISYSKSREIVAIAGALTSSEIVNAWKLGADMVKIFPIKSLGGPSYVKAIKETLPFIEIMTTGGVTVENFTDFLNAGATIVGLSSDLIGRDGFFDRETTLRKSKTVIETLTMNDKRVGNS
jgi:2-dehydro-3-deoxyphosphogluconate aldolase / (4S)-4-hydroxy-2-oxoglutarate aldolase